MNEKIKEINSVTSENMQLGQEEDVAAKQSRRTSLKLFLRDVCYKSRMAFSKKCDSSTVCIAFERLYYTILSCQVKVFGVFLFILSITSLGLSFTIEEDITAFLTSSNTHSLFVIFIISLILLTGNKQTGELLSSSRVFSMFNITYNLPNIYSTDSVKKKGVLELYSTSFFTGILAGFLSVIFPATLLITFALSVMCLLFVINRPECGLPFVVLLIPFISPGVASFIVILTFISLIFKYFRGKRHINFKLVEILIIFTCFYILLKSAVFNFTTAEVPKTLNIFAFFFTIVLTLSLVRSTAMFRKGVSLLITLSHVFTLTLIVYYVLNVAAGSYKTQLYLSSFPLEGTTACLTSREFIIGFLALMVPLNFAVVVGKKSKDKIKNLIFLILLFACSLFVMSYELVLVLLVGCVGVLIFNNIKFILMLIPCPAISFGIMWLYNLIPQKYLVFSDSVLSGNTQNAAENIKQNFFFGNGFISSPFNNTLLDILFTLGIFGCLLVVATIVIVFIKAFKSFYSINLKDKSRTYAYGLVSGAICFVLTSMFSNMVCDFRIMFLFAFTLSLSVASGRCFMSDFIDSTSLREQIHHE